MNAKRRIKLYKIQEAIVEEILQAVVLSEGEHETIKEVEGFVYPLKIVTVVESDYNLPSQEGKKNMKVQYDEEIDALYLQFGDQEPDGVIEIAEGVNIDTTDDGKLVGIEILKASNKLNLNTILSYTLELDQNVLKNKIA